MSSSVMSIHRSDSLDGAGAGVVTTIPRAKRSIRSNQQHIKELKKTPEFNSKKVYFLRLF